MVGKGLKENDEATYIAAMKTLLAYYSRNRQQPPSTELLDSWLTLKGKALDKAIRKQYVQ